MAYTKTTWVNASTPAINETNLNKIEQGIEDAHDTADAALPVAGGTLTGNVLLEAGVSLRGDGLSSNRVELHHDDSAAANSVAINSSADLIVTFDANNNGSASALRVGHDAHNDQDGNYEELVQINEGGTVKILAGKLKVGESGNPQNLEVFGTTLMEGELTLQNFTSPAVRLMDSATTDDNYQVRAAAGDFRVDKINDAGGIIEGILIYDEGLDRMSVKSNGATGLVMTFTNLLNTLGPLYAGKVGVTGGLTGGPAGWTATNPSTGRYVVTHNLGSGDYMLLGQGVSVAGITTVIWGRFTTTFEIRTYDDTGTLTQSAFDFMLMTY